MQTGEDGNSEEMATTWQTTKYHIPENHQTISGPGGEPALHCQCRAASCNVH
jgi:hypothetical protein